MGAPRALRRATARTRYRVSQVVKGFRTGLTAAEVRTVRAVLNPTELEIFAAMHPRDRRHSVDVLRWLEVAAGSAPPSTELRRAALLHDAGKGHLTLLDRVAFVVLDALSPRFVDALGHPRGPGWQQALWRLRQHAALGSARLAAAGAEPRVVALVEGHTGPRPTADLELARLIEADRAC